MSIDKTANTVYTGEIAHAIDLNTLIDSISNEFILKEDTVRSMDQQSSTYAQDIAVGEEPSTVPVSSESARKFWESLEHYITADAIVGGSISTYTDATGVSFPAIPCAKAASLLADELTHNLIGFPVTQALSIPSGTYSIDAYLYEAETRINGPVNIVLADGTTGGAPYPMSLSYDEAYSRVFDITGTYTLADGSSESRLSCTSVKSALESYLDTGTV